MENLTAIQTFTNSDFGELDIIIINAIPWFVGKDIAKILGHSNPRKALIDHVDKEDKRIFSYEEFQKSQNVTFENGKITVPPRGLTIINESGLYSLILSSKLPTAQKFKRWVTSEVLPSIRKYGAYMTPETIEKVLYNPEFIINLASQLKAEQEKNEALTKENKALLTENDVLSGEIQTYDSRKILNALIRALTFRNYNGDYSYAWNSFYKQLKYKYGYDLKIRKGKSKDNAQPLITYLRDDEVGKAVSLAAAMCKEAGLDLDMIINSVNAKNV